MEGGLRGSTERCSSREVSEQTPPMGSMLAEILKNRMEPGVCKGSKQMEPSEQWP